MYVHKDLVWLYVARFYDGIYFKLCTCTCRKPLADLNEFGEEVRVAEVVGRAHCQEDKGHQVRESRVIEDDGGKPMRGQERSSCMVKRELHRH